MSVEIGFPFEFVVQGTPASLQTKRAQSRQAWRDRVRAASRVALPEGHYAAERRISVTLFYFPVTEMQGDIDNIVKPILDALCQHIYIDDKQVERVWVQKFEPDTIFQFSAPSATLASAIQGDRPMLYVRISDDPTEGLV